MKKTTPFPQHKPALRSGEKRVAFSMNPDDGIPNAADIPCLLGGTSKELMVPRPVLRRVAFLQKTTPEKVIETLQIRHGVSVTICDWPTGEAFFLVAGVDRNFPDDKKADCCNCGKKLLISGDAPAQAVPICVRCVQFQAILATTHGVTVH